MKTILIDDEQNSLDIMKYDLGHLDLGIEVIGAYSNPVQGLKAINTLKPELLLLDIEMPGLNGFELLDLLPDLASYKVIFATAYNQYAIKAFKYLAIDYLLKPVELDALREAVIRAKQNERIIQKNEIDLLKSALKEQNSHAQMMVVATSEGYKQIRINDIIRCQATGNYTEIFLETGQKIVVSKSLKYFTELLEPSGFMRVHQSHLIQLASMDAYVKKDGGYIVMNDGAAISVSRANRNKVHEYFKNLSING